MTKVVDNETLLLKVESQEHRIEVLENTLSAAKEVLKFLIWRKHLSSWVSPRAVSTR